VFITY